MPVPLGHPMLAAPLVDEGQIVSLLADFDVPVSADQGKQPPGINLEPLHHVVVRNANLLGYVERVRFALRQPEMLAQIGVGRIADRRNLRRGQVEGNAVRFLMIKRLKNAFSGRHKIFSFGERPKYVLKKFTAGIRNRSPKTVLFGRLKNGPVPRRPASVRRNPMHRRDKDDRFSFSRLVVVKE